MGKKPLSLETKIVVLVWSVAALSLFVTNFFITAIIAGNIDRNAEKESANIAKLTALSPIVIEGLQGKRSQAELQQVSLQTAETTNAQFVVIFDMNGVRKTHPDIQKIGHHIVGGDETPALAGQEYISKSQGTLGESLRAFCPVYAENGQQVGAVVVGISLASVEEAEKQSRSIIYSAITLGLIVGAVGAFLLARSIKKTLFGLEPFEIAKIVEERNAMFQSVREGIIAIDRDSKITLVNDEAIRLLSLSGIAQQPLGRPVSEYINDIGLQEVLQLESASFDSAQFVNGVQVLVNCLPVKVEGKVVGAIATFRDMTEMRRLAEELTGVRNYVEALRSQAHEFMNKMHVILGMVSMQCYDQLHSYINRIAREQQAEVNFIGSRIKEPVLAGFILSKISRARELGIELIVNAESFVPVANDPEIIHKLVTIIGNLIDNAFEATQDSAEKKVAVLLSYNGDQLKIEVEDTGKGIEQQLTKKIFIRGFSTKTGNRGLGLALVMQSLQILKGDIEFESKINAGTKFTVVVPYDIEIEGCE